RPRLSTPHQGGRGISPRASPRPCQTRQVLARCPASPFGGKIAHVRALIALAAAVLTATQLGACGGAPPAACGMSGGRAHPEIGGQILYHCTDRPQVNGGIYLLDVATGNIRALTSDLAWNLDGAWSPDGTRIAFQSTRGGRDDIYVMDLRTGGIRRLTDGNGFNEYPDWSPDGSRILSNSSREPIPAATTGYYRALYVMRPDGSESHRLTGHLGTSADAAWSPDGKRLAFMSDLAGSWDIFTMRADGSAPRQLTHRKSYGGWGGFPRWSPDGSHIVFGSAWAEGDPYRLYSMALGADAPHHIAAVARGLRGDVLPDWSPDGDWIVFSRIDANMQVFAVRPDGSGLTQLTDGRGDKMLPRWRPA